MKFSSSSLLAAFALVGTTTALVPSKLSYLTEKEWEAATANYAPPPVKASSSSISSFLEQASSALLQLGHRVMEDEGEDDDLINGDDTVSLADNEDISTETAEIFDAATGGAVDDDEVASGDSVTFDPPIAYSQYSSDTCDTDTLLYSGTITSIKLLEAGDDEGGSVFCSTGADFLEGDSGMSIPVYTKLTNVQCDVFGVEDKYESCSDADCSVCDGSSYLGLTTWGEVFPDPFEDHCFQQVFSDDGETFDDETNLNVDYQFDTDSTENGQKYTTFIVLNSCIQNFVSSDGVEFTADSITVTDDEGGSTTLTDDSLTVEDADGGSIVITDDAVTLSGADDDAGMVIENADLIATDDGGVIIANDDIELVITEDGDFMATTDDSITYGNDEVYLSFNEESATFGNSDTDESFTIMGVMGYGENSLVFSPDTGGSIEFKTDESVIVEGVDPESGDSTFTTINDAVYNYTTDADSGAGYFTITGSIEECDDFVLGFNAESMYSGSEDCGFYFGMDEDGAVLMTDDFIFGVTDDGGSIVITDDAVTLSGADDDAGMVIENADLTATDDGGVIIANDDIELVITEEGDFMAVTDDSVTYGNAEVYVSFGEESATFGNSDTDESFTIMGGVDFTDDSLIFSPETGGSLEFTVDETLDFDSGTVIVEGVDLDTGDATFTTISDPVYNYTTDADTGVGYFTITGSIEECDDFVLGFNAESMYSGSEACGFLAGLGEEGGFVLTDDSFSVGNDDVYIVFMEDSATFGSSATGSSFTVSDLVIETTEGDDDYDAEVVGVMITNAGGGTITFTPTTVTLGSVNDDDKDLVITAPVYSYLEEKGFFTISGPTEDCDDFGLAFDAGGLVMGSIDCDFSVFVGDITSADIDDEMMMTDDDAIVSASGSGDVSASADDSDGSCETIEELLCSGSLSDKFTVLCSLLQATPIPALTLTIFAPTDAAFGNLLALLGATSAADVPAETLTAILMFHVAPGQTMKADLECGQLLPMIGSGSSRTKCAAPNRVAGQDFLIQKGGGNRKNNIEPTIIFSDIMACNDSVIHVISEVMLPDFIDKV